MARYIGKRAFQRLTTFAGVMLLTRSFALNTRRDDFIPTTRATGLPERQIRHLHAARTALPPVTTSLVPAIDGRIFRDPFESLNPRRTICDTVAEPLTVQRIGAIRDWEERVSELISRAINPTPVCRFVDRDPIATDFCRSHDHPPLEDKGNGHFAACHLVERVVA